MKTVLTDLFAFGGSHGVNTQESWVIVFACLLLAVFALYFRRRR